MKIPAMLALPPFILDTFWGAFTAHHLSALASSLRALSPSTQPKALSTLLQILSLLPDPKSEPYFRKFLRHSPQSDGLPTLIATAFLRDIDHNGPDGPWHLCTLIMHLLFWCDPAQGNDGKASIDAEVRMALGREVRLVTESSQVSQLQFPLRLGLERLCSILDAIEHMQGDLYLAQAFQFLKDTSCARPFCCEDGKLTCSKCKSVRYCGEICQTLHWKNGHKLQCFRTTY